MSTKDASPAVENLLHHVTIPRGNSMAPQKRRSVMAEDVRHFESLCDSHVIAEQEPVQNTDEIH